MNLKGFTDEPDESTLAPNALYRYESVPLPAIFVRFVTEPGESAL
jgi:hypothetical protein